LQGHGVDGFGHAHDDLGPGGAVAALAGLGVDGGGVVGQGGRGEEQADGDAGKYVFHENLQRLR
jgi:hypothetical protein